MLIALIISSIVAFFIGKDASERGMNSFGWGFGVFALMIIFLPLYFIFRKPKQNLEQ